MTFWGDNPEWLRGPAEERAAAMALLEADASGGTIDFGSARNALGAMINRADREGQDLGAHVSQRIYQPTIEPAQWSRLKHIIGSPQHRELTQLARDRRSGRVPDWVQGATHFLAPEQTMLRLEAGNPRKYRSWRTWTGFDPVSREYKGVIFRDPSHAFLAPEGPHSAMFAPPVDPASNAVPGPGVAPEGTARVAGPIQTRSPMMALGGPTATLPRGPSTGQPAMATPAQDPDGRDTAFMGLLSERLMNPLTMMGLSILGSRDRDVGEGMRIGLGAQQALEQRRERAAGKAEKASRLQQFQELLKGVSWLDPATAGAIGVAGPEEGAPLLVKLMEQERARRLAEANPPQTDDIREFNFAKQGGYTGSFTDFLTAKRMGARQETETPDMRAAAATRFGLDPNSDAGRAYILTGKLPREDQQSLTATDKRAILEADDIVGQTESAIAGLNRALDLSKKAYDGATADERAWLTSQFGSEAGIATRELNQVVTQTALQQLKAIFGGNPTEGERKILLDIQGSAELPKAARDSILREGLRLAELRLNFYRDRANQMRGGTFYKPPTSAPPASSSVPPERAQQLIEEARQAIAAGAPQQQVLEELRRMGVNP